MVPNGVVLIAGESVGVDVLKNGVFNEEIESLIDPLKGEGAALLKAKGDDRFVGFDAPLVVDSDESWKGSV
jgi:hypothetical protein